MISIMEIDVRSSRLVVVRGREWFTRGSNEVGEGWCGVLLGGSDGRWMGGRVFVEGVGYGGDLELSRGRERRIRGIRRGKTAPRSCSPAAVDSVLMRLQCWFFLVEERGIIDWKVCSVEEVAELSLAWIHGG
eukprot:TRINITY_DN5524_c0_g1_i3.p1 TRINITY_DN5524_c0_g1~~TRINITY_DN5524_c0_g1_i3.p1  ORF type:complete len:132 (-),score=20.08 TRINITY_DN5524_c0_g1_i3:219-614(-)